MPTKVQSLIAVFDVLNKANVLYLVVGGLAVVAHGYARLTKDVDLVLSMSEENIVKGLDTLASLGYKPKIPVTAAQFACKKLRESWILEKNMIVLQLYSDSHRETPIDVFIREPFDFAEAYKERIVFPLVEDVSYPAVSYTYLKDLKLTANRPQDIADIERLDRIYERRHQRETTS